MLEFHFFLKEASTERLVFCIILIVCLSKGNRVIGSCLVKHLVCLVIDEAHRATGNYAYCVAVREVCPPNTYLFFSNALLNILDHVMQFLDLSADSDSAVWTLLCCM